MRTEGTKVKDFLFLRLGSGTRMAALVFALLVQAQTQPTCFEYCINPCSELLGEVTIECGKCTDDKYLCRPGAQGYKRKTGNEQTERRYSNEELAGDNETMEEFEYVDGVMASAGCQFEVMDHARPWPKTSPRSGSTPSAGVRLRTLDLYVLNSLLDHRLQSVRHTNLWRRDGSLNPHIQILINLQLTPPWPPWPAPRGTGRRYRAVCPKAPWHRNCS